MYDLKTGILNENDSILYLYEGSEVELEFSIKSDGTLSKRSLFYYSMGKKLCVNEFDPDGPGSLEKFFHQDILGNNILLTDTSGDYLEKTLFGPFGDIISERRRGKSIQSPNRYNFTGKERDSESDLDYFGARYLDYNNGRWMKPDLISVRVYNPQTLNKYLYCINNPVNYIDYLGLLEENYEGEADYIFTSPIIVKDKYLFHSHFNLANTGLAGDEWSLEYVENSLNDILNKYKSTVKTNRRFYASVLNYLRFSPIGFFMPFPGFQMDTLDLVLDIDSFFGGKDEFWGSCTEWSDLIYYTLDDFIEESGYSNQWEVIQVRQVFFEIQSIGYSIEHNFVVLQPIGTLDWKSSNRSFVLDPWYNQKADIMPNALFLSYFYHIFVTEGN